MLYKLFLFCFLYVSCSNIYSQDPDTLNVVDFSCVSMDPYEIDTTYFTFRNDSLFIRNIRTGFCCPQKLICIRTFNSDTMLLQVKNPLENDCLCECAFGYTVLVPQVQADEIVKLEINGEFFKVKNLQLGISGNSIPERLIIHPNPTEGIFKLGLEKGLKNVSIMDQLGKIVYVTDTYEDEIKISNLSPGVYEVMVEMEGELSNQKLIIR